MNPQEEQRIAAMRLVGGLLLHQSSLDSGDPEENYIAGGNMARLRIAEEALSEIICLDEIDVETSATP